MWSSTSDHQKREDLEDCSCSSDSSTNVGAESSSAAATVAITSHLQAAQQQPNTNKNSSSEDNSNLSGQTYSDNDLSKIKATDFADISCAEAAFETQDSGFISGPQTTTFSSTSQIGADEEESSGRTASESERLQSTKTVNRQQLNIAVHEEDDERVLDSGCIDEEFDKEDEQEEQYSHQNKEQKNQEAATTTTTSDSSGSSAVAAGSAAVTTAATEANQMILKQNVDAGMSERFCNLSLQNTPTTQQQMRDQTMEGAGVNNLNAAGRGVASQASAAPSYNGSNTQSRQQQAAAANPATTTNLTASNAWEQFYQQNDDGDTPLHLACISGFVDVVAALIRMAPHPCLFNIQNDEAQTPLHLAVLTTQPKIVRMLLIAGAEPTIRDRHGNTALHLACIAGEEQCVRALTIPISASEINEAHRQYGHRSNDKTVSYLSCARLPSDLEIRNYDGERCVHLAAQAGHIDVLRILVLYGADINAREGKSGRTPLHIAIECCNEDLANFLLDECLKINLETATYAGLTPYQVACILNKSQMQNMLEKHGAEPLTPPDSDYDSDIESDLEDSKIYDRFGDPGYFVNFNGGNFMTVA